MNNFRFLILIIFSSCLIFLTIFSSCERTTPSATLVGQINLATLEDNDNIPLEYGQLVAITGPRQGLAHLWFQDDNLTIRMVEFYYGKSQFSQDVRIIERKMVIEEGVE